MVKFFEYLGFYVLTALLLIIIYVGFINTFVYSTQSHPGLEGVIYLFIGIGLLLLAIPLAFWVMKVWERKVRSD